MLMDIVKIWDVQEISSDWIVKKKLKPLIKQVIVYSI